MPLLCSDPKIQCLLSQFKATRLTIRTLPMRDTKNVLFIVIDQLRAEVVANFRAIR
jgi:hypothetical protein